MEPEAYIVRVYRRTSGQPAQIAGQVETPGGTLYAGFASLPELVAILEAPDEHLRRSEASRTPDGPAASAINLNRQEP